MIVLMSKIHWFFPGVPSDSGKRSSKAPKSVIVFQVVNRRGHGTAADWWSYGVLMVSICILKL